MVEGSGSIDVCVVITGLPVGGALGCDVTVDFNFIPGAVASMSMCMYVSEIGKALSVAVYVLCVVCFV